jgi:hypothetical protein
MVFDTTQSVALQFYHKVGYLAVAVHCLHMLHCIIRTLRHAHMDQQQQQHSNESAK